MQSLPILILMTLTFMGDSLTAGNLGVSFLKYLEIPDGTQLFNRGRDGDTVRGLLSRLDETLRADGPDVLVIEVGANDILLPEMSGRGKPWIGFIENMLLQGSVPSPEPEDFAVVYSDLLRAASDWGIEKILCLSIPPIGEDVVSDINRKRMELNEVLRTVVTDSGFCLLDIAKYFEAKLEEIPVPSDYFFSDPSEFITDKRRLRRDRGAMKLSEERGLYYTMDGAHLNEAGAKILGSLLSEALNSL